ncbi:MAG: 16S rRNA (cytosine(1402)-N(4))-methyltransferase RsmH [Sporolactobacillus sp.]
MFSHETVLRMQAVSALSVKADGIYVDCTLGGGGHSLEIVKLLSEGHLYAFDRDCTAIEAAGARLSAYHEKTTLIKANFNSIQTELQARGVSAVDGILFDLGVSSPQFDRPERGFSYRYSGPLDMRMDQSQALNAEEIVNTWPYERLVRIFFMYGEERFAKPIARRIEQMRAQHPITTTDQLAELIKAAIPAATRRSGPHPAKRVFQALRIAVNDELGAFETALDQSLQLLRVGGRLSVITFHSLEDRLCKQFIKAYSEMPDLPPGLPVVPTDRLPVLKRVNKKPVVPGSEEITANRRAHSAKLRVAEKIHKLGDEFR